MYSFCDSVWLGRFIKRLDLDSLPLFLNVMRGEMSLVGPHPVSPNVAKRATEISPQFADRTNVKPGLVSLVSLSDEDCDLQGALALDLFYVKHRDFKLDMTILSRLLAVQLKNLIRY